MYKGNYELITDLSIVRQYATERYEVVKQWEYVAKVEGARDGLVDLFLTKEEIIYVEIDMDPLYGGGYAKREKVQKIADFKENGAAREIPNGIIEELKSLIV
ncbi:hypothetical protein ACE193_07145 [Bernardetia sp. OM2101]|uniref:hypothetical protein n=1 Tax=Bernardetia sp. OM2101 TaxID=3344876 RepID=UPI0035CF8A59